MKIAFVAWLLLSLSIFGLAQESKEPGTGAYLPAQAAADILKEVAATDGAFIPAGNVNGSYDTKNLASLMSLPAEKIAIVSLTGSAIKEAFQRSVSLFPQPNTSFLQISGFKVVFKGSGSPDSRIISVEANDKPLDLAKTYTVAMPSGLAAGAMGYFKIWDKSKIDKTLDTTLEKALQGKPYVESQPRWVSH